MNYTRVIFIRHGDVYNPRQILYARLPGFRLSQTGKKNIENLAVRLKNHKYSAIYASPLLRTRQSAIIMGKILNLNPRYSNLLLEVKIIYEGVSLRQYHQEIQYQLYNKKNIVKGQESISEIFHRMNKFVIKVHQKHSAESIIAVSHGDPIMILKAVSLNIEFNWEYKHANYLKTGNFLTLKYNGQNYIWE